MADIKFSELDEATTLVNSDETILSNKRRTTLATIKSRLTTAFDSLFVKLTESQEVNWVKIFTGWDSDYTYWVEWVWKTQGTIIQWSIVCDSSAISDPLRKRRFVQSHFVKNQSNEWGVGFATYVDADYSITGNRQYSIRGYPKRHADWTTAWFERMFTLEFDTYDGVDTYSQRARFFIDAMTVTKGGDVDIKWEVTLSARLIVDNTFDTVLDIKEGGKSRRRIWKSWVESWSNSWSDFVLWRYADNEDYISTWLIISRETGETTLRSLVLTDLPTSATWLATGTVWNDWWTLKIA